MNVLKGNMSKNQKLKEKIKYYNLHDLVNLKVVAEDLKGSKYIHTRYSYFLADPNKTVDIVVRLVSLKNFPEIETARKENYKITKDSIVWSDTRRLGKWKAQIRGLKSGNIEIYFAGNAFSYKYLVFYILEPLINMALMRKGFCLVHASCFSVEDRGFLVSAYPSSGKTSILLQMLANGADYLADEMTIISKDGFAYLYYSPVSLSDYNLKGNIMKQIGFLNCIKKYIFKMIRVMTGCFIKLVIQVFPEKLLNGGKLLNVSKIKLGYIIDKNQHVSQNTYNIPETMLEISKVQYGYFNELIQRHVAEIKGSILNEYWDDMLKVLDAFCQKTESQILHKGSDFNVFNEKG